MCSLGSTIDAGSESALRGGGEKLKMAKSSMYLAKYGPKQSRTRSKSGHTKKYHGKKLYGKGAYPYTKLARNPDQLLFRTRAAALKYAREHGAKRFSIKKLKRGK